jgi:hypothetical protein
MILAAVVWVAGEQHYTACITKAAAPSARGRNDVLGLGGSARQQAINGGSRWPW